MNKAEERPDPPLTRRSPRFTSQRELGFTKITSPFVTPQTRESRKEPKNTVSKANTELHAENITSNTDQQGTKPIPTQGKELRRSKRISSPKVNDNNQQKNTTNIQRKESCSPFETDQFIFEKKQCVADNNENTSETGLENTDRNTRDRLRTGVPGPLDRASKARGKTTESLQVRELRKIEDYWTRNSPSTEQSPRLRSSAKTSSNLTKTLNDKVNGYNEVERNSSAEKEIKIDSQSDYENIDLSLPESPLPRRISQRIKSHDLQKSNVLGLSKHAGSKIEQSGTVRPQTPRVTKTDEMGSPHKTKASACVYTSRKAVTNASKNSFNLYTTINSEKDGRPRVSEQPKRTAKADPFIEIVITDFKDSESEDDDDYIPPRKKLRSEVSTEELWEGFPSFSFKRLPPNRKSGGSSPCGISLENTPTTSKATALVLCENQSQENKLDLTVNGKGLTLTHLPKLESTDKSINMDAASEDVEGSNKDLPKEHAENRKIESIHQHSPRKELVIGFTAIHSTNLDTDTPKKSSVKRKYSVSPNMALKRSARLQEKRKQSPTKPTAVDSTAPMKQESKDMEFRESKIMITSTIEMGDIVKPNTNSEFPIMSSYEGTTEATTLKCDTEKTSTENIKTDNKSSALSSCSSMTEAESMQSKDMTYTQLKENNKDLSILEILTQDFNEQTLSSGATSKLNPIIAIEDSENRDEELDGSQESKVSSDSFDPEQIDLKATESVSSTLFDLLGSNTTHKEDRKIKTENTKSTLMEDLHESPFDDLVNNNISDRSLNKPIKECRERNIQDLSGAKVPALFPNSSNCNSSEKEEMHVSVEVQKLKLPKGVCEVHMPFSSSVVYGDTKRTTGNNSTKKKVPPLRIKLKPKISHLTKKDVKKKKAKLPENSTKIKIRKDTSKSETDNNINLERDDNKKCEAKKPRGDTDDKIKQLKQSQKKSAPKNKKSKKPVSKRRKGSPTVSIMELRLNNERRQAMAEEMLSNPVLDKHACVIWSSENRRHIVLSKPDASHSDIDDILRHKWENLSDKEKLRYFQRAKNAIKDENRHSSRKHENVVKAAEPIPSTSCDPNPSLTRFIMMTPFQQLSELKKWLHFYHDVSVDEYSNVLNAFKTTLQKIKAEKEKQRKIEKKKNKLNAKSKKKEKPNGEQKKQEESFDEFDAQSQYRKLLFEKIFEVKDKVLQMWKEKKEKQKEKLYDSFSGMVKKLIVGDNVRLSGNVVSGRLTEVLTDIKNLETDRKLGVSGHVLHSESFVELVKRQTRSPDKMISETPEETLLPFQGSSNWHRRKCSIRHDIENISPQQSSSEVEEEAGSNNAQPCGSLERSSLSSNGDLPQLNPAIVQEVFNEINNVSQDFETYGQTRARLSPSSLLTSWVIADLLEDQDVEDEAQRNINNNTSHTPFSFNNREFKSILNLGDVQRKYGAQLSNGANTKVVSSDAYLLNAQRKERENVTGINLTTSVPQSKLVSISRPYFVSGSRPSIIALQHYNNGKPVVRYARMKPTAYSATQLRNAMISQRQKIRFTPQVKFTNMST